MKRPKGNFVFFFLFVFTIHIFRRSYIKISFNFLCCCIISFFFNFFFAVYVFARLCGVWVAWNMRGTALNYAWLHNTYRARRRAHISTNWRLRAKINLGFGLPLTICVCVCVKWITNFKKKVYFTVP